MQKERPRLTKHQIQKIRKMDRIGISKTEIAKCFGITVNHVLHILSWRGGND